MHRALGARRFILLERTFAETLPGIIPKLSALKAKLILVSMLAMTMNADHSLNGLVFPCHSGMAVRHDKYLLMLIGKRSLLISKRRIYDHGQSRRHNGRNGHRRWKTDHSK
jgi:hypothetical protein